MSGAAVVDTVSRDIDARLAGREYLVNPYPVLDDLREYSRTYWFEHWQTWLVSRHEDVTELLRNDVDFSAVDRPGFESRTGTDSQGRVLDLLNSDPPEHGRLRSIENRHFTPRAVERRRADLEAYVHGLLDQLGNAGEFDFRTEIATPASVRTAELILGLEQGTVPEWLGQDRTIALDVLGLPATSAGAEEARRAIERQPSGAMPAVELDDLAAGLFDSATYGDKDESGVVQSLCAARRDGTISAPEYLAYADLLLRASIDNARNFTVTAARLIFSDDNARQACAQSPAVLASALEEVLRFEPPVQRIPRRARRDIEFAGAKIRRDEIVMAMIGAANRDPRAFEDPSNFDIRRFMRQPASQPQLALSIGRHVCLGASLTRMQTRIVLESVLQRFPGIRLVDSPSWMPRREVRALGRLPVAVR
jgi:pimeloyl-[acyl-carrier protein] synthase